jgi:hypothetical protein
LSFAEERIGPLAAIVTTVFYLLALYLLVLPNTPENLFASIYRDSLFKTAHQHLLLLVGFDTLIYRKYYDTPPILVGHQRTACRCSSWPSRLTHRTHCCGAGPSRSPTRCWCRHWASGSRTSATRRRRGGSPGPDLGLCDLVRRPGAHIRKGPIILYTLLHIFLYI